MTTIRTAFYLLTTRFADKLAKSDVYELLEQVLKRSYADLVLSMDDQLSSAEMQSLDKVIQQLTSDYPVAYLTGHKFFYKDYFFVNPDVLIPRSETEIMVDQALAFLKNNYTDRPAIYYDLCTGSGNIGLSVQKYFPKLTSYLNDNSLSALEVARTNQVLLKTKPVNFLPGDFVVPFLINQQIPRANLVTINPPYIDLNDNLIAPSVMKYEPSNALYAPDNGLFFYEQVADHYQELVDLDHPFLIMMEFGADQKREIETIFTKKMRNDTKINFIKDFDDHWRFITITN